MQRTLNDQCDTGQRIYHGIQSAAKEQASLGRLWSTQHEKIRDHLQSQTQDQSRAFASQNSTTDQIGVITQDNRARANAIEALQQSFAGFVSLITLIQKAKSDASNNSQRFNAFPGANA